MLISFIVNNFYLLRTKITPHVCFLFYYFIFLKIIYLFYVKFWIVTFGLYHTYERAFIGRRQLQLSQLSQFDPQSSNIAIGSPIFLIIQSGFYIIMSFNF